MSRVRTHPRSGCWLQNASRNKISGLCFELGHPIPPASIRAAIAEGDHERLVQALEIAPHAQRAHPTAEHFLPLLTVIAASSR